MSAQTEAMKHTKVCPECGGTEIYKADVNAMAPSLRLLPDIGGFWSNNPQFDAFVCAKCGYYQLFVGEEWLPEIRTKWERHE